MNNKVNRALVAKKPSFKTTTLIAAIGMIVYTIYVVVRYAIHEFFPVPYHYDLLNDIQERIIIDILPVSLIIAGAGLWEYSPSITASKSFRALTICLFIALIGTLLVSPLYTYQTGGWMGYLFPKICWRSILLVSGIVWLFMFRRQPLEETSPRSYRVTLILAMLLLALPMVLEAISGISLLCGRDIVLGLNSGAIKSWVKYIAPILPLVHFVFPRIEKINYMCNNHCTPGSYERRTFKRNRMITLVLVGVMIISGIVGMAIFHGVICHEAAFLKYGYLKQYTILHNIGVTSLSVMAFTLLSSYIMLSIMAFRYLPNPRGYKIYNIACQVLTWGCLIPAIWAPSNFNEIFGAIFLFSFCAFFITTTIRVISYSIPIGVDKLKGVELKEGAIIPD